MTPDALPVTRRGVTRWEEPAPELDPADWEKVIILQSENVWLKEQVSRAVPDALALDDAATHRDRCLQATLAALLVEVGRIGRVVDRIAQARDVRIEVER